MDFFEHQAAARKRTGLLLGYFALAVLLTIVAVNLVAWLVFPLGGGGSLGAWLAGGTWLPVSLATLAVIAGGSLLRYVELGDGSHSIARAVHATRIDPDTADPQERVLLNVVEEMAIASGTPVPTVYVMRNEPGINAFVAGFEPTSAVLVVTRGALESFTRDEMQGVVGHEFSHILNGDMRMNVHLYAILAGILMIGRVGEFLLRGRGRGGSRGKNAGLVVLLGAALMAIGYIGLFFGRLIKAAISRQRELLADASSVQFTRNPQGLGEALLKIRNASGGALLADAHAEDMSHMCIALPVKMGLAGLLATHPPLDDRINAIDPTLLVRDRARARMRAAGADSVPPAGSSGLVGTTAALAAGGLTAGTAIPGAATTGAATPGAMPPATATPATGAQALAASIGQPAPANLALARRLHQSIPENIRDLLRTPAGARIVSYGILIAGTDSRHEADALQRVAEGDSEKIAARLRTALPDIRRLGTRLHLPCHDLALVALRDMSPTQKNAFVAVLIRLIRLDNVMTVREYVMLSLMRKYLLPGKREGHAVRHRSYSAVAGALNGVLSLLCHAAGGNDATRRELHARVIRGFAIGNPELLAQDALGAGVLHEALLELAGLSPLLKKPLLDACIDCISHDGLLQVTEIELVRAIGEALDCPIPPLPGYG